MGIIQVYHGGHEIIDKPICAFGRDNLDFGKGFYVTDIREQAVKWAKRPSLSSSTEQCILNMYALDKGYFIQNCRCRIFPSYDEEWLKFIIDSRMGKKPWANYDYVEGGVANDRVIDTVNLYIAGLMDLPVALKRLSLHRPNNQICLLNQSLTDKYLTFVGYEHV